MVPPDLLGDIGLADLRAHRASGSKKAIAAASGTVRVSVVADAARSKYAPRPATGRVEARPRGRLPALHAERDHRRLEFHWVPDTGDVPLVAHIPRPSSPGRIDVTRFGVIYAGAQKNIGPAVARDRHHPRGPDRRAGPSVPAMLDYKTHAESESM